MSKNKIKLLSFFIAIVLVFLGCGRQPEIKNALQDNATEVKKVNDQKMLREKDEQDIQESTTVNEPSGINKSGCDVFESSSKNIKEKIGDSDWLTYRSDKDGFEVSYPKIYSAVDWSSCYNSWSNNWEISLNIGKNKNIDDIGTIVQIGVEKNINKFNSESVFFPLLREDLIIKDVVIGKEKYKAKEVSYDIFMGDESSGESKRHTYFVEYNNKLFWIDVSVENGAEEKYQKILDSIIFFK